MRSNPSREDSAEAAATLSQGASPAVATGLLELGKRVLSEGRFDDAHRSGDLTPQEILALQRSAGNAAVSRLLARQKGGTAPSATAKLVESLFLERLRLLVSDHDQAFLIERGKDIYLIAKESVGATVPSDVAGWGLHTYPYTGQHFQIRKLRAKWREKVRAAELPMISIPAGMPDWVAWISPPWFKDPRCDYLLCDPARRRPPRPAIKELERLSDELADAAGTASSAIKQLTEQPGMIGLGVADAPLGWSNAERRLLKATNKMRRLAPLFEKAQGRAAQEIGQDTAELLGRSLVRRVLARVIPVLPVAATLWDLAVLAKMLSEYFRSLKNAHAGIERQKTYPEFNFVGSCPDFAGGSQYRMGQTGTRWSCVAFYPTGSPVVEGYALDTDEGHRGAIVQYWYEYVGSVPQLRKSRLNPFTGFWDEVPLPEYVRRSPSTGVWEFVGARRR